MVLYIIRHGQTDSNKMGIYNGRFNEDLNATGIEEANNIKEEIGKLNLDLIICSPLLRTKHTADIINVNKVPIIYDERIIERDHGDLTGKHDSLIDRQLFWNYYSNLEINGLESVPKIFNRVHSFLNEIKNKYKDKNILLVTHGGVFRAIHFYFNDIPENGDILNNSNHKNCELKKYYINE